MRIFLLLIGIIALVCGIKFIFDARVIAKKYFCNRDINDATLALKIVGFIVTILGSLILYLKF